MKRPSSRKKRETAQPAAVSKSMATSVVKRASIFRNGSNQAVRLPQDLRFGEDVKEVRIRKQGDGLLLSPIRPGWAAFFAMKVSVPDDFLEDRQDLPPQSRDPL